MIYKDGGKAREKATGGVFTTRYFSIKQLSRIAFNSSWGSLGGIWCVRIDGYPFARLAHEDGRLTPNGKSFFEPVIGCVNLPKEAV